MRTHFNNRPIPFESQRVPIDQNVLIRSPHFKGFMSEYASNISITGMFIRSESPLPVETVFACEFRLAEDLVLIEGECQVVWVREEGEGVDLPRGMGVRFLKLDPQSRRLIRWTVERHIMEGGTPFELESQAVAPTPAPAYSEGLGNETVVALEAEWEPASGPPDSGSGTAPAYAGVGVASATPRSGLKWLSIAAVALLALFAVAVIFFKMRSSTGPDLTAGISPPVETPAADPPGDGSASDPASGGTSIQPPGASTTPPGPAVTTPAPEPVRDLFGEIETLVNRWAAAWSNQQVDAYLACYSQSFGPQSGSLSQWRRQRRQRITAPKSINIAVAGLVTEDSGPDRARATFSQTYTSDAFEDRVRKVFELIWEDGEWKILAERSE